MTVPVSVMLVDALSSLPLDAGLLVSSVIEGCRLLSAKVESITGAECVHTDLEID